MPVDRLPEMPPPLPAWVMQAADEGLALWSAAGAPTAEDSSDPMASPGDSRAAIPKPDFGGQGQFPGYDRSSREVEVQRASLGGDTPIPTPAVGRERIIERSAPKPAPANPTPPPAEKPLRVFDTPKPVQANWKPQAEPPRKQMRTLASGLTDSSEVDPGQPMSYPPSTVATPGNLEQYLPPTPLSIGKLPMQPRPELPKSILAPKTELPIPKAKPGAEARPIAAPNQALLGPEPWRPDGLRIFGLLTLLTIGVSYASVLIANNIPPEQLWAHTPMAYLFHGQMVFAGLVGLFVMIGYRWMGYVAFALLTPSLVFGLLFGVGVAVGEDMMQDMGMVWGTGSAGPLVLWATLFSLLGAVLLLLIKPNTFTLIAGALTTLLSIGFTAASTFGSPGYMLSAPQIPAQKTLLGDPTVGYEYEKPEGWAGFTWTRVQKFQDSLWNPAIYDVRGELNDVYLSERQDKAMFVLTSEEALPEANREWTGTGKVPPKGAVLDLLTLGYTEVSRRTFPYERVTFHERAYRGTVKGLGWDVYILARAARVGNRWLYFVLRVDERPYRTAEATATAANNVMDEWFSTLTIGPPRAGATSVGKPSRQGGSGEAGS